MTKPDPPGPWDDAEIIAAYTRAQAVADGVLVDVSPISQEAGFKVSVAMTASVWARLTPSDGDANLGQSIQGRLWDVLMVLRARARDTDIVLFDVIVAERGEHHTVRLKAIIGPGDDGEPVITIMFPNED